jgi:iron complex outermembrane receptor protein
MNRFTWVALAMASATGMADEERMEHVLVSVPIHKKTAETALPVTVLTGDELRRSTASTLGETLGNKPGIANASFGPGVGRPVIRGQQGPRALMLQNGTSVADVSSLSPDHGVAVEPVLADSIEVLRGPSTLLYGGGAIGGVANVIDGRIPTSALDGIEGALEYRYDDASEMDSGVFRLDGGNGKFAFHLSGTTRDFDDLEIPGKAIDEAALEEMEELLEGGKHGDEEHGEEEVENTDGYIANTDGDADTLTGGVSYHFGERGFFGLSVSRLETEYGIPPGAHGHHHEEEEHGDEGEYEDEHGGEEEENVRIDLEQTRYDAVAHVHDLAPGLVDIARAFVTYTDYEHDELEGSEVGTQFDRETWEGRLELVHDGFLHGVVGLQWRADEFEAVGEEAYVPMTDSTEWGLFIVEDFHSGDWQYELGARVDWVERDPEAELVDKQDFTSVSLSAAALWRINGSWDLGVGLSSSQRAPSTEELFSNADAVGDEDLVTHAATGIIEVGHPGLDEETAINLDVNLSWSGASSWAQLSAFYNSFEDYIFLLNSDEEVDETPVYNYAQDDAEFYGVEFESSFRLAEIYNGELALGLNADVVVGEFDDAGDVPRLPPFRAGAKLSWTGDSLAAWVSVLDVADQDDPGEFETETEGYTRWDAGLEYRWSMPGERELLTYLKCQNIGDEEIRLSTSFLRNVAPQAGRSVSLGLRLLF